MAQHNSVGKLESLHVGMIHITHFVLSSPESATTENSTFFQNRKNGRKSIVAIRARRRISILDAHVPGVGYFFPRLKEPNGQSALNALFHDACRFNGFLGGFRTLQQE